MDEKALIKKKKKLREQFQIAAFHIHYRINRRAGKCNAEAFVQAIAATSDQRTEEVLKQCPDAIERWAKVKRKVHYYEKDTDYRNGTNPYVWEH